jgi:hypothetical protein
MARRDLSKPLAASTFGEDKPKKKRMTRKQVKAEQAKPVPKKMTPKKPTSKSLNKTPKKTPLQKWVDGAVESGETQRRRQGRSEADIKKGSDRHRKRISNPNNCANKQWRAKNPNQCAAGYKAAAKSR